MFRTKNVQGSCKGCTRREVGCHSKCEDYKEYRKQIDEINEKAQKIEQENIQIIDIRAKNKIKRLKRGAKR